MKPTLSFQVIYRQLLFIITLLSFFSFSVYAQSARDECPSATILTSATSCSNTSSNISGATASAGVPVGCASVGIHYDYWYSFTALATSHTVTISNRQNNFNNPEVQLFSGTCGALVSLACGATTVTATGLSIGNVYYLRVSNVGTSVNTQGKFDICVTHPQPPPANDNCITATTLTPAATCNSVTANLRYATSAGTAGTCGGATASTTYDVWFTFQATATTQAITVNNLGIRLTNTTTWMEVFSGTCGTLTAVAPCQNVSSRLTLTTLIAGNFYFVRVYVTTNPTASATADWNFNICVQQPPANDNCAGAVSLTAGATCNNTTGSLDLSTPSALPPGCFGATYFDVWYSFVATAISHTITLSGLGSNFTPAGARLQIYSGTCGILTALSCVTATTITQGLLTPTSTYYVRVAHTPTNPSGAGTIAGFNICVTAAAAPPGNDFCGGAITLASATTCSNIAGTLIRATFTAGVPAGCGNAASPDVWYSFVAQTAYPQIELSGIGSNLQTNGRVHLLTGSCGTLTNVYCHNIPAAATTILNTSVIPGGLTVGQIYFIRIAHQTLTLPVTSGNYNYNICITDIVANAAIQYGKSYVNITDGTVGGTINPGDVLEIRATLVVGRPGNAGPVKAIDSVAYYDTLSAGMGFGYMSGTIALRTNEGKLYSPSSGSYYTDAHDITDAGWYSTAGLGSDTTIQINMGLFASSVLRGKLRSSSRPSFNSGSPTCIILATYRVVVNAGYGTKINFGGGAFRYRDSANGTFYTINFPRDSLMVYESPAACPDAVSASNVLGDEMNGTFGASSGSPVHLQNRTPSLNTDYAYTIFSTNTPNDNFYGVANNSSAAGSTNQLLAKGNAARVHNVWDISGDHTGATNIAKGNLPCNLSAAISPTNPCGYMLVINSAYRTDKAFEFNVSGACAETNYEISGWFKNICYKCGCDSTGRFAGASYIPTGPGDSSGVRPNIAIQINGTDYYTTGDLTYNGLGGTQSGSDTLNTWVRRSFVYKTAPGETSFVMDFRNNAPGGGGNDWALDDVSLRTCSPNMTLTPGANVFACVGGTVDMATTVTSYYNNYVYYQWEESLDDGSTWNPIGGPVPPATPVWNGSAWEYTVAYPTFVASAADSGKQYRVNVASNATNINNTSCRFTDGTAFELNIDPNCNALAVDKLLLKGKNLNNEALLEWSMSREEAPVKYELQKSTDGIKYVPIATLEGHNNSSLENNHYSYTDAEPLSGVTWYRVKMLSAGKSKFSNVAKLIDDKTGISIQSLINPFNAEVKFELVAGFSGNVEVELLNHSGQKISGMKVSVKKGINYVSVKNTGAATAGFYMLRVSSEKGILHRKLIKR